MSVLSPYRVVGSHDFAQNSSSTQPGIETGPFNSILDFVSEVYLVSSTKRKKNNTIYLVVYKQSIQFLNRS
jgi:nuclear pore complex protein Nup205